MRYTIEQANAVLPQVRAVLLQLAVEQRRVDEAHTELHRSLSGNGNVSPADEARQETEVAGLREGIRGLLMHLDRLGVEVRDLEMGLVDFPGERDGQPVWLCWRLSDPAVAFWHTSEEGYSSRKPW